MIYATIGDLEAILPREQLIALTDENDTGEMDIGHVNTALGNASIKIDGYLAGQYTLPLTTPPPILMPICCQIAGYQLHVRSDRASDIWKDFHDSAIRFLEKVSEGKLSLGMIVEETKVPVGSASLSVAAPKQIFTEAELDKF